MRAVILPCSYDAVRVRPSSLCFLPPSPQEVLGFLAGISVSTVQQLGFVLHHVMMFVMLDAELKYRLLNH